MHFPGCFHHTDTNGQLKELLRGLYEYGAVSGTTVLPDFYHDAVNDILKLPPGRRSSISINEKGAALKTEHEIIEYLHGHSLENSTLRRWTITIVHGPVVAWHLIYGYRQSGRTKEDRFKTLAELREYFDEFKRRGELVGYVIIKNRQPGFNDHLTTTGRLYFWYRDQSPIPRWKQFENVFEMVEFFKDNPLLAKCVGYKPKQPLSFLQ